MLDECDRVQYLRTLPPADKYKVLYKVYFRQF